MSIFSPASPPPDACPVCRAALPRRFVDVQERTYWRCDHCEATFLDPCYRLAQEEELAHYRHHQNERDDPRYRGFLSKLADPLLKKLKPGMTGLDYGCGQGPALAAMLEEAGLTMSLYDPFFHDDRAVLKQRYDVITLSEVAEHLFDPAQEFDFLAQRLKPDGWLGVMTCFQTDDDRFASWHYRRDPTHVVFYRYRTFEVIAAERGLRLASPRKDVALLQKRRCATA